METRTLHTISIQLGTYILWPQLRIIPTWCQFFSSTLDWSYFTFFPRMPAFNESMLYVIFFVAYLLVNLYLFMNFLLAVIFSNYKQQLQVREKTLLTSTSDLFLFHLGRSTIDWKTSVRDINGHFQSFSIGNFSPTNYLRHLPSSDARAQFENDWNYHRSLLEYTRCLHSWRWFRYQTIQWTSLQSKFRITWMYRRSTIHPKAMSVILQFPS